MDPEKERMTRIILYQDALKYGRSDKLTKANLVQVLEDLKAEGNQHFHEGSLQYARGYYERALELCLILERNYYYKPSTDFIGTLHCNKAMCCLKLEEYDEALEESNKALQKDPSNVKAMYRKVLALKHLRRLKEALDVAEQGQLRHSVFDELVDKLRRLVGEPDSESRKNSSASVSLSQGKTVPDEVDPDWLEGTNIEVVQKQQKAALKKMPVKKKKTKQASSQAGAAKKPAAPSRVPEDSTTESDSEESTDLGEDDSTFANNLASVSNHSKFSQPAGAAEEESIWGPTGVRQKVAIVDTISTGGMGLDDFGVPPTKPILATAVVQSNGSTGPPKKKEVSAEAKLPAVDITWPLEERYDFRLACKRCYVKIGEGSRGYKYNENLQHSCERILLIVKLKKEKDSDLNWLEIRPRVMPVQRYVSAYKICKQFASGVTCQVSKDRCSFPHHQAELRLWTLDHDGEFDIREFIIKLKSHGIYTSEQLAARAPKPKPPEEKGRHIPGLNFVEGPGKKSGKASQAAESSSAQKTSQQSSQASAPKASTPSSAPYQPPLVQQQRMAPRGPAPAPAPTATRVFYPSYQQGSLLPQPQVPQQRRPLMPNPMYAAAPVQQMLQMQQMQQMQQMAQMPQMAQMQQMMQPPAEPVLPLSPPSPQGDTEGSSSFPLAEEYDFKFMCSKCLVYGRQPGVFIAQPNQHSCEASMLVVYRKGAFVTGPWYRVRERLNHRKFRGNYLLCNSIKYNNMDLCKYKEDKCSFAHNEIEQLLWSMEKDGKFNITEFIMQNHGNNEQPKGYTVQELLKKHGGLFYFICHDCYFSNPPMHTTQCVRGYCQTRYRHPFRRLMVHSVDYAHVSPIFERKLRSSQAFYLICHKGKYCQAFRMGHCVFAHSVVERDVWMVERDTKMTKDQIVEAANRYRSGVPLHHVTASSAASPSSSPRPGSAPQAGQAAQAQQPEKKDPEDICPFIIKEYCGTCWKSGGLRTPQDGTKDRCEKNHNHWKQIRLYLTLPSLIEVRPLPRTIPTGLKFLICKYVRLKGKCEFNLGGPCQFAHSEEEIKIWKWMCNNNVRTLEELSSRSQAAQKAKDAAKNKLVQGDNVVSVTRSGPITPLAPSDLNTMTFYCPHCSVHCNSQRQWDNHCASENHSFNVNSDSDHQWNFRQPPWGQTSYSLCERHKYKRCQFSNVEDMYNYCTHAHSQDELEEWNERTSWRRMKREMARNQKLFSYMDQLLEEYHSAQSGVTVLTAEEVDYASIECDQDLTVYSEEKTSQFIWMFRVVATEKLAKVSLLLNRDRLYFYLMQTEELDKSLVHQLASGDIYLDHEDDGVYYYNVRVGFVGKIFGSFAQWVTFDFDIPKFPVLYRKISIELGNRTYHDQVKILRQKLTFDHWTGENRTIVGAAEKDELETKYKSPLSSDMVVTAAALTTTLNRHNYKHKMHQLLYLEEMTRHRIISSYNLRTRIDLFSSLTETRSGMCHSRPGELFAKVPLAEYLTEDTNAGKLILSSVRQVLIAPADNSAKTVYLAEMVREDNFNFDGRNKHYIFINLPKQFVRDFGLQDKTSLQVELQFQMNRLHFCRMHHAVDSLATVDVAFPDISKVSQQATRHLGQVNSKVLNPDQLMAVRHIVAERHGYSPPYIINGPFGTGKTATLAQCAMTLTKDMPHTRILICAQSNSAADLYITKHLDAYLTKRKMVSVVLRVYSSERHMNTVPDVVKKYCLVNPATASFRPPKKEEVIRHRIIITTVETALQLLPLGLHGHFTHIFIDEAAQGLECETIMPLCLATEKTCVVMTGDHMQMSPKVYSPEARLQGFHISMLERLFNFYEANCRFNEQIRSSPLNLLLSINYRTKMEILRFISALFYGGPDNLKAMGNIPSVVELTPMVFYCVQGCEVQDPDRTSYYNSSEVEETVERVEELYNRWPQEWGPPTASDIQVVTPYYDQVIRIRRALRQRNPQLRDVNVNRVHECQGKEYRALFISTVRTRHLLSSSHVNQAMMAEDCDGDIGDFGFLSDQKLLNTAFTRAQSFVAVVGDPVALCAIGECVTVWRTYLKHCNNMKSLHPPQFTYQGVKNAVIQMQLSPEGQRLKEIMEVMHGIMPIETESQEGLPTKSAAPAAQTRPALPQSRPAPAQAQQSIGPQFSTMAAAGPSAAPRPAAVESPGPSLVAPRTLAGASFAPGAATAQRHPQLLPQQLPQQPTHHPRLQMSATTTHAGLMAGSPAAYGRPPTSPISGLSSLTLGLEQPPMSTFNQAYSQMPGLSLGGQVPQQQSAAAQAQTTVPLMPSFHSQAPSTNVAAPPALHAPLSMPMPRTPAPLTFLQGVAGRPRLGFMGMRPLAMARMNSPEDMEAEMLQQQLDKIFRLLSVESLTAARNKEGRVAGPADPRNVRVDGSNASMEDDHAVVVYSESQALTNLQQGLPDLMEAPEVVESADPGTMIQRLSYNLKPRSALAEYRQKPDQYRRAVMRMEDSRNLHALVLDPNSQVSVLRLASSHDCGQAFHQDEVVVALAPQEPQTAWEGSFGKVIGILRRNVDMERLVFVCRVEYSHAGRLIPLTPGIPAMRALTTPLHPPKPHHVCVYQVSQGTITFSRYEPVDGVDSDRKLFMARYLKWDAQHHVPLAIVFGTLDCGSTVAQASTILDMDCRMIRKFKPETEAQMNELFPPNFIVPESVYNRSARPDSILCFSIAPSVDSPGTVLAFNINEGELHYTVQVHIAHVAALIPSGSVLDAEASTRGCAAHAPGCEPVPILPPRLSTDLCLFKQDRERVALTVHLTIGKDGSVLNVEIRRSAVRVQRQFTYAEVEGVLRRTLSLDPYKDSLLVVIQQFASLWRGSRLGHAAMQFEPPLGASQFPRTEMLLEDVAILVNTQVGARLQMAFPNSVPMLVQGPPNAAALQEWCRAHAKDASCSLSLAKPFLTGLDICHCQEVCTCIQDYMRLHQCEGGEYFHVTGAVWQRVVEALYQDPWELQHLLSATSLHPQLALASQQLLDVLEPPHFVVGPQPTSHFSLNVGCITSCTNPVKSFLDLTVQRIMCALVDGQPQPYKLPDLEAVCEQANQSMERVRRHFRGALAVSIAAALQKKPAINYPVVEKADASTLKLCFPEMKEGPAWERAVDLKVLGPCEVVEGPMKGSVSLTWQERIYNYAAPARMPRMESAPGMKKALDPDRLVLKVPSWLWQSLMQALRQQSDELVLERITAIQRQLDASHRSLYSVDVSCEAEGGQRACLYSEFSLDLSPANLLRIQMAAATLNGLLTPSIQLLSLTPTLDLCLEHRARPQVCFAPAPPSKPARDFYSSPVEYQQLWQPVVEVEAAQAALQLGQSVVIHNVQVEWQGRPLPHGQLQYTGTFSLTQDFLSNRQINLWGDLPHESFWQQVLSQLPDGSCRDLVCVRSAKLELPVDPNVGKEVQDFVRQPEGGGVTWVGHCVVTGVEASASHVLVRLKLHQSAVPLPDQLRIGQLFTIEWIPKPHLHRSMEYALVTLNDASSLSKAIATGRPPEPLGSPVTTLQEVRVGTLPQLSPQQQQVVERCLSQSFTLVTGAAGTGKTLTAVHLAFQLVQQNRLTPHLDSSRPPPQLLVCAPTERALDVLSELFIELGVKQPRLVRVYGVEAERQNFPLPNDPRPPKKTGVEKEPLPSVKQIALHELIRCPSNVLSQEILEGDRLLCSGGGGALLDGELMAAYLERVQQAKVEELRQAEVILCTCATAASTLITDHTNIAQIMEDEVGSCMEPEALVPVVLCREARQVIMVGDAKQMQAMVHSPIARNLGLQLSLLERYGSHALKLSTQYRTHQGIFEFPQEYFYRGQLDTFSPEQSKPSPLHVWPGGPSKPVVFLNLESSAERTQAQPTSKEDKVSKINEVEVHCVVKLVSALVRRLDVPESSVAVLSPFEAHCQLIRTQLLQSGCAGVTVSTVPDAQGREYDYVIYSTVRTLPKSKVETLPSPEWVREHLGPLADEHQVNLAITRARRGLMITGSQSLLGVVPVWMQMLQKFREEDGIMQFDAFLNRLS